MRFCIPSHISEIKIPNTKAWNRDVLQKLQKVHGNEADCTEPLSDVILEGFQASQDISQARLMQSLTCFS